MKRACVLIRKMKEKQHGHCAQNDGASLFNCYNFFGNYEEGKKECLKNTMQRARNEEQEPC